MTEETLSLSSMVMDINSSGAYSPRATNLKRSASPSCESELASEGSRKRLKEESPGRVEDASCGSPIVNCNLVEELSAELQCGCCSELVYRPVLVTPCQHFFCGSCCSLWIRNGGTNCPACRGVSDNVSPFRPLQVMLDALLRAAPHKARSERERKQADEIYTGQTLRIPKPREASPGPDLNQSVDLARPCPYCNDNSTGYRCPQPIPDPAADPSHAWHLENGSPPGHAHCGNCENLLALRAPTTSKCDLCQVSFCGINVQGRCMATPLASQHPHNLSDIGDLIQSSEVYECFDGNTVEVEIMFDYLTAQRLTPRHIYREIITHIQAQPRGFHPLIELELFSDVHGVASGIDPDPASPRNRICRMCAAEVLLYGLKDWWIRERQKGFLEENVLSRKDCPEGSACTQQKLLAHAKEFNHIIPSKSGEASQPEEVSNEANTILSGTANTMTSSSISSVPQGPEHQSLSNSQPMPSDANNPTLFVVDVNPTEVAIPSGPPMLDPLDNEPQFGGNMTESFM
ncbi:hypothetical protein M378DRAFT_177137 [Amanita muscaria Koide BX008]|uniref:RING-type domain-containing protein n=1 Tax=Amanita muscaria (strain Koide BX008) TaxID=946122 RepID=A0A0C2X1A3_AMAMK|nr:hypothetical protein M378DRAFT_177137 [Amanita muscaria Koide BX008]